MPGNLARSVAVWTEPCLNTRRQKSYVARWSRWYGRQAYRSPDWLCTATPNPRHSPPSHGREVELRIGAGADEHEVSNEADELGEAKKHAGGSCPIAPARQPAQPKGVTAGQRLGAPIELTPHRLRHTWIWMRAGYWDATAVTTLVAESSVPRSLRWAAPRRR